MEYYIEIEKSKFISIINPDIQSLYIDDRQYNLILSEVLISNLDVFVRKDTPDKVIDLYELRLKAMLWECLLMPKGIYLYIEHNGRLSYVNNSFDAIQQIKFYAILLKNAHEILK